MRHEIPASFVWSEQDYVAFIRGARMLHHESYDSWIMRAGLLLVGHLFLLTGFLVTALAIFGGEGQNGPIPREMVLINLVISSIAAYVLFTKWYGLRWLMNRAFRASQLPGLKVSYFIRPTEIESTNRLCQSKRVWSVFSQVVEFRDAFILVTGGSAEWLPRHAFAEPFDDVRFAELARESVGNYKFIDRATFPKQRPMQADELS